MKCLLHHTPLWAGLLLVGCAAPRGSAPNHRVSVFPAKAADAVSNDDLEMLAPPAIADGPGETSAAAKPVSVTAVNFQTPESQQGEAPAGTPPRRETADGLQPPLEAVTPPTSPGPSPHAAGNVFLPPPEIPAAPSVSWQRDEMLTGEAPLTLDEAEAIACGNNPTLLQARSQVEGTLGKAIQAGLWPNPTVMYAAEQIGVSNTPGEFHGAIVRQRIVTAHKLDLSREKYLARTRTASWLALAQQYRVLNDVRIHYFRARGRQELVTIQRELLKNAEDNLITFREMHNVGQATRAEVHQANMALQNQRLSLLMAENDYRQTTEQLTALTGLDLAPETLATPLEGELALIDFDQALERLLRESPELAAARSKLEADRVTVRREIAEPVPDLVVQGGSGYNFVEKETVAVAQLGMEIPVFDWNQGTIRQAEADYARQQGEVRRTELTLRQRLAAEYRTYLTAVQHVRNFEEVILPEARAVYDVLLQSYETDRAPWVDVLAAERDYFQHRAKYIGHLIAWRESEVRILGYLLHGGLNAPSRPTPPGHIDSVPQPR